MDYNVKYHIDINGEEASNELERFRKTVMREIPVISKQFSELRSQINRVRASLQSLQPVLRQTSRSKINLDISPAKSQIRNLKKELNSIRNRKVTLTVDTKTGEQKAVNRLAEIKNGPRIGGFGGYGGLGRLGGRGFLTALGVPFADMLGVGMVGLGVKNITKDAVEYDNVMSAAMNILKVGDKDLKTFDERFGKMAKHMRQIGVETKFSAVEVADATKYLAMAGLNIQDIENAMRPISNLAIIGDADLGTVADYVTNIITGYGIGTDKMAGVTDIMTVASTQSNTNVLEMAEAFKYASGQLSLAKVSFNEASAAIGVLADAGLKGTLAGTGLRAMMMRLVSPPKQARDAINRLGVSFFDIDKNGTKHFKSLYNIFDQLEQKGASVSDMNAIFAKTASNAANALLKHKDKLREMTNSSIYSGGLAQEIAEERQNTVKGLWYQVTSQFTETGMNVFESMQPVIKEGLRELIDLLKQPETAKIFQDVAKGVMALARGLFEVGSFVVNNWHWIEPLVLSGFFSLKLIQIASSVATFTVNLTNMLSIFRGLPSAITSTTTAIAGRSIAGGVASGGLSLAMAGWIGVIAAAVTGLMGLCLYIKNCRSEAEESSKQLLSYADSIPDFDVEEYKKQQKDKQGSPNTSQKPVFLTDLYPKFFSGPGRHNVLNRYDELFPTKSYYSYNSVAAKTLYGRGINKATEDFKNTVELISNAKSKEERDSIIFGKQNSRLWSYNQLKTLEGMKSAGGLDYSNHIDYNEVNTGNESTIKEYQMGYGSVYQKYLDKFNLLNKALSSPSAENSTYLIESLLGKDVSKGNLGWLGKDPKSGEDLFESLNNDSGRAKAKSAAELLNSVTHDLQSKYSFSTETISTIMRALGYSDSIYSNMINPDGKIPIGNISEDLEKQLKDASGTGTMNGANIKKIEVHIDNLCRVDNVDIMSKEDMATFKERMSTALMDIVKDFEISSN